MRDFDVLPNPAPDERPDDDFEPDERPSLLVFDAPPTFFPPDAAAFDEVPRLLTPLFLDDPLVVRDARAFDAALFFDATALGEREFARVPEAFLAAADLLPPDDFVPDVFALEGFAPDFRLLTASPFEADAEVDFAVPPGDFVTEAFLAPLLLPEAFNPAGFDFVADDPLLGDFALRAFTFKPDAAFL